MVVPARRVLTVYLGYEAPGVCSPCYGLNRTCHVLVRQRVVRSLIECSGYLDCATLAYTYGVFVLRIWQLFRVKNWEVVVQY